MFIVPYLSKLKLILFTIRKSYNLCNFDAQEKKINMKNIFTLFTFLLAFVIVAQAQDTGKKKGLFNKKADKEKIETPKEKVADVIDTMVEDEAEIDPDAPVFEFIEETYDFGDIIEGDKPTHEFKFTNTGNSPLIISGVKASCGCTTPEWPKTPIAPGEEANIKAIYNSKGRIGKFNKAIRITSNAATPTKVIYIKGETKKANTNEGMPVKKPSIVEDLGDE